MAERASVIAALLAPECEDITRVVTYHVWPPFHLSSFLRPILAHSEKAQKNVERIPAPNAEKAPWSRWRRTRSTSPHPAVGIHAALKLLNLTLLFGQLVHKLAIFFRQILAGT